MKFKKIFIYLFCGFLALSSGFADAMRRGGGGRSMGGGGRRMGGMRRGGLRMGRGGMRMGPRNWRGRGGWRRPYRRLRYGPRIWWGGYPYWRYNWDPYCTVWNPNNPYCYDSGVGISVSI